MQETSFQEDVAAPIEIFDGAPVQGASPNNSAARRIRGIETVNMIRKGQVRLLEKGDTTGQAPSSHGYLDSRPRHKAGNPPCRATLFQRSPSVLMRTSPARSSKAQCVALPEHAPLFRALHAVLAAQSLSDDAGLARFHARYPDVRGDSQACGSPEFERHFKVGIVC